MYGSFWLIALQVVSVRDVSGDQNALCGSVYDRFETNGDSAVRPDRM